MGSPLGFLYSQLLQPLPRPTESYAGKTVVVTGGSAGLGREAAQHYARLGAAQVVLAVRSPERGRAAQRAIEAATGCAAGVVAVWPLDLADPGSVAAFAARLAADAARVDVFLANAGVAPAAFRRLPAGGDEETVGVNVVGTLLLVLLVLPVLARTAARRGVRPTLVVTTSEVHAHTTLPQKAAPPGRLFAALSEDDPALFAQQYPVSKLLEVLAVRALAEQAPADRLPVTVNCVNPGLCHSELARDHPGWGFWLVRQLLARSAEVGSRALVHAGAQGAESHGQYLSDCRIAEPSPWVVSEEGREVQQRVWEELKAKLEAIQPGVTTGF